MKVTVNVNQEITSRVGLPIGNGNAVVKDGEDRPALLLRDVIVNSIDTPQQADGQMALAPKLALDRIARACVDQDEVELEATDWAMVEDRIGTSGYSIGIIGEACHLMSPQAPKTETEGGGS